MEKLGIILLSVKRVDYGSKKKLVSRTCAVNSHSSPIKWYLERQI